MILSEIGDITEEFLDQSHQIGLNHAEGVGCQRTMRQLQHIS